MLTERRAAILRMVVSEYIRTAEPVSSKGLVDRHRLSVSSATIRNEFARLEEEGYITHPYTSAGRIPSDRGYRHYVESLMAEEPVGADEQRTIEHQLHQVLGGLDEWLSLTATILAAAVGNVAVVTRPRATGSRLKHLQLVELHGEATLLVAVMDDGRVRQRILPAREPAHQAQLTERAQRLNMWVAGADSVAVRALVTDDLPPDEAVVLRAVSDLIDEERLAEETFLDGLRSVLQQPEFSSVDRMLEAVRQLEAYRVRSLLEHAAAGDLGGATRVLIGREHGDDTMQDWSVVVSNYGDAEGALGTIAVVGPTRMRYERTIPRVRYVSTLMSQLLQDVR
ncbi:MAG: heat-inducible transcription repressor HrcA [Dehalococcoidia bacterium]|nr:heat-inducible transcription repressor HrcA [Dehalococcoidia bacterium]